MTEYQQDMWIVNHYRERLTQNVEVCDCQICDGDSIRELGEIVDEISEYWVEVDRDTH